MSCGSYFAQGFYGSEKHAKYYSAGVADVSVAPCVPQVTGQSDGPEASAEVCAFEHLHERHIIYRLEQTFSYLASSGVWGMSLMVSAPRVDSRHKGSGKQNPWVKSRDLKPENLLLNEKGHLKASRVPRLARGSASGD